MLVGLFRNGITRKAQPTPEFASNRCKTVNAWYARPGSKNLRKGPYLMPPRAAGYPEADSLD